MKPVFVLAALASNVVAQFDQSSQPFRLFLQSSNTTLNGTTLGACHQGAAIEGLCFTGNTRVNESLSYETFYHQTASNQGANSDPSGVLTYNLTIAGPEVVPSAMRFSMDVNTNIAIPLFFPGDDTVTAVSFASGGCMYIPNYVDDTVSPPEYLDEVQKVENWYVCLTRWSYLYETLVWKIGRTGEPQNPTCQKVRVVREFI